MLRRLILLLLALALLPGLFSTAALAGELPEAEEAQAIIRYLTGGEPMPDLMAPGQLEVHCISVGAADAFLLRADGETMLIDCGQERAGDTVLAYLAEIGVDRLDYAMMTHMHNDHIGGYLRVLAEMPVGTVILPAGFDDFHSKVYDAVCDIIAEKRIPKLFPKSGTEIPLGSATLAIYQWQDGTAEMNDRSLVTLARIGARSMIFTADVENNGQKALAAELGEALQADVIKMPHHGLAAYMQDFHDAVQPQLAIFTNAKHRVMERNRNMLKRLDVELMVTTIGPLVLLSTGDVWDVWQAPYVPPKAAK